MPCCEPAIDAFEAGRVWRGSKQDGKCSLHVLLKASGRQRKWRGAGCGCNGPDENLSAARVEALSSALALPCARNRFPLRVDGPHVRYGALIASFAATYAIVISPLRSVGATCA